MVAKTIKESGKSAGSSLAHPGGLESWQPSGRWQQALGAEHLHDQTKRQRLNRCQWMPVGEEGERSIITRDAVAPNCLSAHFQTTQKKKMETMN